MLLLDRIRSMKISLLLAVCAVLTLQVQAEDNPLRDFFPYGVYIMGNNPDGTNTDDLRDIEQVRVAIERTCKDLAEHHMNAAWPNNLQERHLPTWLEMGRKYGIRIMPQLGGPPVFVGSGLYKDRDDLIKRVSSAYKRLIDRYGTDTALLAWSLGEENRPLQWLYEGAAEVTRRMSAWDPAHPAIMLDNRATSAMMNARLVKPKAIVMGCYPFFANPKSGPTTARGIRSYWSGKVDRMRYAADSVDAVLWVLGQGMEYRNLRGETPPLKIWRWPTPAEIRWQVWSAIQHGAKGFFYFIYYGLYDQWYPGPGPKAGESLEGLRNRNFKETPQFRAAAEVGMQLKHLAPVLLRLDIAPPNKQVEYWENTAVSARTHVDRATGRRFVSMVNNDWETPQAPRVELGYWPGMIKKDEQLFDLLTGAVYDKEKMLSPGSGAFYFVGTADEWKAFSGKILPKNSTRVPSDSATPHPSEHTQ